MTVLEQLQLPEFDPADTSLLHLDGDVHRRLRSLVGPSSTPRAETTQAQLAHALRLFAAHPDQWSLLAREPERVPAAVDEVLRHEPTTAFTARITTSTLTGNRDGAGDPDFDITAQREGARLLTFGAGVHFCLGADLARLPVAWDT